MENESSSLIAPHGGKLVHRILAETPDSSYLAALPKIILDDNHQMDVEQIANGTYSPLEGFMGQADFHSVLDCMRLDNGVVWPLPILLDVSEGTAETLSVGDVVCLTNEEGDAMAVLHVSE